jgi:hypothetical protein
MKSKGEHLEYLTFLQITKASEKEIGAFGTSKKEFSFQSRWIPVQGYF